MVDAIPETLAGLRVPIGRLRSYGRNPRRGNVDRIAESLQANGQYRPVVVNARTDEVLAGNHTLAAAQQLGWTEVAATFVDVDDEAAARIALVDNRANDLAGYDDQALLDLLHDVGDLAGTGYDPAFLAELEAALDPDPAGDTDPDDIPPEPVHPFTRPGQTWLLGQHRLTIGDATDPAVVGQALGGRLAELVVTDPPYNVAYFGKTKAALTIANDEMGAAAFSAFLGDAYTAMLANTIDGGPIYVFHPDGGGLTFRQEMVAAGWELKQVLVWIKDRFVLSRQDYHWQHEPILYGWKPGAAHRWYGGFTPATVLDEDRDPAAMTKAELLEIVQQLRAQSSAVRADRPAASRDHPTAKPTELLRQLIDNSSRPGELVLDPFGGSGSTLIAAHRSHRLAALVELDPVYADVICRRYQEHTGQQPRLEDTGEPHDFTP